MKELFIPKKFKIETLAMIKLCNQVIDEYQEQGFSLTLRQLYYQLVSRDVIENTVKSYKNLGSIVNDGRLAGLIDWLAIEDRTRNLKSYSSWDNPGDIIASAAQSYHVDHWAKQEYRPEVWIEKDALVGVIDVVCGTYDIPYFSCRGYTSQSEMWRAAKRILGYARDGFTPIIFHLGDHDPSGIDMTRDIEDRVELLSGNLIEVKRLALNMEQVEEFKPPPNPAKMTDARFQSYMVNFGTESWELDALNPATMHSVIETSVLKIIDEDNWSESHEYEEKGKSLLLEASKDWTRIEKSLEE